MSFVSQVEDVVASVPWPPAVVDGFNDIMAQRDERVIDWWLMNPAVCGILTVGYLLLIGVLVVLMKIRGKPFEFKKPMLIHNFFLTGLSLYMMTEILRQAFVVGGYSLWGNPVDRSEKGLGMAKVIHIYYMSKVVEFLDTVFMALRCKFRQISFLHVYHHASIFVVWWIVTSIAPGGESYFTAMLNSFIHVLLYGYYLWSSVAKRIDYKALNRKPRWTEPAFYRKYITTAQLTQFMFMLCQAVYVYYYTPEGYPRLCATILFFYMLTMIALFGNFYIKQYLGAKNAAKSKKKPKKNGAQQNGSKKRN